MTAWPVRTPPVKETMSTPGWPDQRRAERGVRAVHHVEHARRQRLGHGGGHQQHGGRAGRRRLDHHGVAGEQRREDLVGHDRDGPVEGQDGRHHAVGHPLDSGGAAAQLPGGQRLGHHRGEGGGHAAHGGGVEDGLEMGLAVLAGEQAGQVVGLDQGDPRLGGRDDRRRPLVHRQGGPRRLGPAGRRHGPVQLGRRGRRRLEHHLGRAGPGW